MPLTPTLDGLSEETSAEWIKAMIRPGEGAVFLVSSPDAQLLDDMSSASAIQTALRTGRKVVLLRQPDPEVEEVPEETFSASVMRLIEKNDPYVVVMPEVFDVAGFKGACALARAGCTVIAGFVSRNSLATLRRLVTPQMLESDLRLVRGALGVRSLPKADSPSSVLVSEVRLYGEPVQILADAKVAEQTSGDVGFAIEALRMSEAGLVTIKSLEGRFVASDLEEAAREIGVNLLDAHIHDYVASRGNL